MGTSVAAAIDDTHAAARHHAVPETPSIVSGTLNVQYVYTFILPYLYSLIRVV